jgi:type II secretory pathway component GspD/PulD (secretin)
VPSPPPAQFEIPVWKQPAEGTVDIKTEDGRLSLTARSTPLSQVISMLAQSQGINVVCAQDISATVSIVLRDVTWQDALTAVLSTAGYTWVQTNGIVRVTSIAGAKNLPPDVQGRRLEVFPLDYASGTDMEKAIKGLLSPVGQVTLSSGSPTDSRKPKDTLVVEDLPASLERIANYIRQMDRPPRQVLIEAQVLEVVLSDEQKHGVNFKHLFSIAGNGVELELTGMADPKASPAFFARLGGGNLEALLECLKSTQNTRTMASPRVLVMDGQEAKIQIGEQLGYRVTTTTETSTMQNVKMLEVGVILMVTPHVARDGRVWMKIKPKVSTGRINPDTELPEEKTSELESQVLLENGQGIIIGGLIQETDSTTASKMPLFGDMWLVGGLFRRKVVERIRKETVVGLVPHVQPFEGAVAERNDVDVSRCQTPLVNPCLQPMPRPWEPAPGETYPVTTFLRSRHSAPRAAVLSGPAEPAAYHPGAARASASAEPQGNAESRLPLDRRELVPSRSGTVPQPTPAAPQWPADANRSSGGTTSGESLRRVRG